MEPRIAVLWEGLAFGIAAKVIPNGAAGEALIRGLLELQSHTSPSGIP